MFSLILSTILSFSISYYGFVKDHPKTCLLIIILIIVATFASILSYLLIHEYYNMKHNIEMNYALHHFMNRSILQGISIFMKLTSMVSILGYILQAYKLSPSSGIIIFLVLTALFIFVFLLSDITFNEFLYRRNKYIFSHNKEIKGDTDDIFIKPIKIINNITRDKMPKTPHVTYIRTSRGKIKKISKCTKQLVKVCKLNLWYFGDTKKDLSNFCNSVKKVNLHQHISKHDVDELRSQWFNFDYELNKDNLNISNKKSIDKLNYRKMMVTKALY